jgi:dynein heavy chain 1
LDIVNKFVATEAESRSQLEQQQGHIRTGLGKLLETQNQVTYCSSFAFVLLFILSVQVNQLRQEMVAKEQVLRAKDTEANNKLSQMVEKQNEAEQRKTVAERLTVELQRQEHEINTRRTSVEAELSEAEPSLIAAKHSVQNIRKAQLDEVRSLIKPPNAVKLTLEMVAVMIGEPSDDWDSIRKVIRKDDFIATVVNFDPTALSPKQVKQVQDNFLSNTDIDYNSVDRASKACGPLYQWAVSQIKYAVILKKVKPLRDEVQALMEQVSYSQGFVA